MGGKRSSSKKGSVKSPERWEQPREGLGQGPPLAEKQPERWGFLSMRRKPASERG